MDNKKAEELGKCTIVLGTIIVVLAIAIYQPFHEKQTFNKFKRADQPEATYFDAVFSRLRITSQ